MDPAGSAWAAELRKCPGAARLREGAGSQGAALRPSCSRGRPAGRAASVRPQVESPAPPGPAAGGKRGKEGVTVAHLGLGNRSGLPRFPSPVSANPSSVLTLPDRDEILVRHQALGIEPDVQSQGPAPRGLQLRPPAPPAAIGLLGQLNSQSLDTSLQTS